MRLEFIGDPLANTSLAKVKKMEVGGAVIARGCGAVLNKRRKLTSGAVS